MSVGSRKQLRPWRTASMQCSTWSHIIGSEFLSTVTVSLFVWYSFRRRTSLLIQSLNFKHRPLTHKTMKLMVSRYDIEPFWRVIRVWYSRRQIIRVDKGLRKCHRSTSSLCFCQYNYPRTNILMSLRGNVLFQASCAYFSPPISISSKPTQSWLKGMRTVSGDPTAMIQSLGIISEFLF